MGKLEGPPNCKRSVPRIRGFSSCGYQDSPPSTPGRDCTCLVCTHPPPGPPRTAPSPGPGASPAALCWARAHGAHTRLIPALLLGRSGLGRAHIWRLPARLLLDFRETKRRFRLGRDLGACREGRAPAGTHRPPPRRPFLPPARPLARVPQSRPRPRRCAPRCPKSRREAPGSAGARSAAR